MKANDTALYTGYGLHHVHSGEIVKVLTVGIETTTAYPLKWNRLGVPLVFQHRKDTTTGLPFIRLQRCNLKPHRWCMFEEVMQLESQ